MAQVYSKSDSREINRRLLITGLLELETPAHFGGGENNELIDMPLRLDHLTGIPVLRGTSLAGALRSYLRQREAGYFKKSGRDSLENLLFGPLEDEEGAQSWLVVSDAFEVSGERVLVEMRDGVKIDPQTRTALDGAKYDFELLPAGTVFETSFELLLTKENEESLLEACALVLDGLQKGEIILGARRRRGFGRCRVKNWAISAYDLSTPQGLLAWVGQDSDAKTSGEDITALLGAGGMAVDRRRYFEIKADFLLDGPMIIRAGGQGSTADAVHLTSRRPGSDGPVPIVSGTSLAGALRGRALRICRTLALQNAEALVESLFGGSGKKPEASRLWVSESCIKNRGQAARMSGQIQDRIRIDRFTGGVSPGALFDEQPFFPAEDSGVQFNLQVQEPQAGQIGLLLLLLKDLWTGDLPLGGESSVGRGRLKGVSASLCYQDPDAGIKKWSLTQDASGGLLFSGADKEELEKFVQALAGGEK